MIFADTEAEKNCSWHNILYPAKYINKQGDHHADVFFINDFMKNTPEVQASCEKADLIIIERNLFGDALLMEMLWWVRNKPVAIIFDDAYHIIEPENMSYPFWGKSQIMAQNEKGEQQLLTIAPKPLTQLRRGVRMAKALITPSKILSDDWKDYTKVYRTHNYLDLERYPESAKPLFPHDDIVIGWCGSMSHISSFTESGVLAALTYVARKYPNVRVMTAGDNRVFDKINLPDDKKFYSPFVPEDQWASLLKSIDIGIAPLASAYDHRRSWIKVLEYMITKVPFIATNFETYEELFDYGTYTENGVENWKNALCYAVEHLDEKREMANGKAYQFALEQSYEKNISKLLDIYWDIIKSPDRDD
jgi:glycosyltransferase involved in cell wall biosynthesis